MKKMNAYRCRWLIVLLGFSLMVGLTGCSDEDEDTVETILPELVASVSELHFGAVHVDEFLIQSVTVRNIGSDDATMVRVTSTDEAFHIGGYHSGGELIPLVLPVVVPAYDVAKIYVGFYPEEDKLYTATLLIESLDSDGNIGKELVDLKGLGLPDED